jgi:hypothetical protein
MEYQVLYEDERKILEVRRQKKFAECQHKTLSKLAAMPSVNQRHSAKLRLCRVSAVGIGQTTNGG